LKSVLDSRQVVRATLMRCTLHLMSARDYLAFRAMLQPGLTRAMRSILRERADTFAHEAVVAEARRLFEARPRTFTEVRNALAELLPDADERAMGYAVRTQLPLVVVPGGHAWGFRADGEFITADAWLGRSLDPGEDPAALILRYLAAFGPASAGDVQAWSGLS